MTSSPRSIIAVDVGEKRLHLAVGPPGAPRSLRLSTSAERWPDRLDDLSVALLRVAAAEAAYRALLHWMGARSLSRDYGAGMEPAHSELDWHST